MGRIFRILLSVFIIVGVSAALAAGTIAFFSDIETSFANTFQAGDVDLIIGNTSYYNGQTSPQTSWNPTNLTTQKFFDFIDVKPGDWGEDTISLQVNTNDAWVCANVTITDSAENEVTEPEASAGDSAANGTWDGELDEQIEFAIWADDGDNVYEDGDTLLLHDQISYFPQGEANSGLTLPLVDSSTNIFGAVGDPLPGSQRVYIGKAWCFGDLDTTPLPVGDYNPIDNPPTCTPSDLNTAQTDSVRGDISFTAVQVRHNDNYLCDPNGIACTGGPAYLTSVSSVAQALLKNGDPVATNRSDVSTILGVPNGSTNPPEWFSLGFGGTVSALFDDPITDQPGNDLTIYEITNGNRFTYPEETALIEVSQNGVVWHTLGTASSRNSVTGESVFDLSTTGLPWIQHIRITDTSNAADHTDTSDGFDLDAIKAETYNTCIL